MKELADLKLVDVELGDIDTGDYPDFCDAYISYTYSEALDRALTDDELDLISTECSDFVHQQVMDYLF